MMLAVAPTQQARTPVRTGWKSDGRTPWPTLGWRVLDWMDACLPLTLTDEQARRTLWVYRLDPLTGRRVYTRVHEEEAKGWGKGPESAMWALAEFGGALTVFDHWGRDGQPEGRAWPVPHVQVVAVSEAQTFNVWQSVMQLTADARGELARRITVDSGRPGRTMLRRRDVAASEMKRVTASALSREGALPIHSVLDEVQLWDPENGGDELARVILRNLTKTGGWAHFTGNAPLLVHPPGEVCEEGPHPKESVAEFWSDRAPDALHFATRPSFTPAQDSPDADVLLAINHTYRDAPWIDPLRVLADGRRPQIPWHEFLRYSLNIRQDRTQAGGTWMPMEPWVDAAKGPGDLRADTPTYACVRIAHDHTSAGVAYAQRQGDRVVLRCRAFQSQTEDDMDLGTIEDFLAELHRLYPARVLGLRRWSARTPERLYPMAGPEIAYNGAFFERSAQVLKKAGLPLIDIPNSQERIAPASEQLLELVLAGRLSHDGGTELTRQMGNVLAKAAVKGWTLENAGPVALAAMVAVERAMKAPREPSRKVHGMHR